jgi:hypothetical protein
MNLRSYKVRAKSAVSDMAPTKAFYEEKGSLMGLTQHFGKVCPAPGDFLHARLGFKAHTLCSAAWFSEHAAPGVDSRRDAQREGHAEEKSLCVSKSFADRTERQ